VNAFAAASVHHRARLRRDGPGGRAQPELALFSEPLCRYSRGMIEVRPTVLEGGGIRLEPLTRQDQQALAAAAADGRLWELWFTAVPSPDETEAYVDAALRGQKEGHMLPWTVRDAGTGAVIGSTRYHDIVPAIDRVEIGYTWYAASRQRTHVNTTCKLLLLDHAFDALGCKVVGLRTDNFNFRSQRAIEALGARKDGVLRHHAARRDGTVRDSVLYSILATEWPDVRRHLEFRLARHATERE
jgi:RimJ/RimL family protein N-acetyltransferase